MKYTRLTLVVVALLATTATTQAFIRKAMKAPAAAMGAATGKSTGEAVISEKAKVAAEGIKTELDTVFAQLESARQQLCNDPDLLTDVNAKAQNALDTLVAGNILGAVAEAKSAIGDVEGLVDKPTLQAAIDSIKAHAQVLVEEVKNEALTQLLTAGIIGAGLKVIAAPVKLLPAAAPF